MRYRSRIASKAFINGAGSIIDLWGISLSSVNLLRRGNGLAQDSKKIRSYFDSVLQKVDHERNSKETIEETEFECFNN